MTARIVWRLTPLAAVILTLAACAVLAGPSPTPAPASGTPTPGPTGAPTGATLTSTPDRAAASPTGAPAPPGPGVIRLWLPDQLETDPETPAGGALARRLAGFEFRNQGLTVELRLKRSTGRGGLLDSLSAAAAAAPAALPDIVALNQSDLAAAANKGLIAPLAGQLSAPAEPDYFPFAVELSEVDGVLYGLPFAGNAQMLAYNTLLYPSAPLGWTDVISGAGPFLFPAGDQTALFTLGQYLALDGALRDSNGQPALDAALLAQVLEFYRQALQSGVLPLSALDYPDAAETWRAFREARAALAVVSFSDYLADRERVTATGVTLIPVRDGAAFALAGGWSWALVSGRPEAGPPAEQLLDWLLDPTFLGEWTAAMRMLPAQAAALDGWPAGSPTSFARQLGRAARLRPPGEVLSVFGPVLEDAVRNVLGGQLTPQAAAINAAAQIGNR